MGESLTDILTVILTQTLGSLKTRVLTGTRSEELIQTLLESLILAQDERWRRA